MATPISTNNGTRGRRAPTPVQLQLCATYHISADIEGDDLCDTINHLRSCITLTPTGRIEGLPTQEEFRLRTIKTKDTWKRKTAMNWRNKIAEDTK